MFPKNTRILVVDDQVNMRNVLVYSLNELGYYNVESTDNAFSALDKIMEGKKEENPFDIVFSDWNMPDMSGYDLLKTVKSNPILGKSLFVLVTTVAEKDKIMLHDSDRFIIRPH